MLEYTASVVHQEVIGTNEAVFGTFTIPLIIEYRLTFLPQLLM
jgi:hypothetical protein